MPTLHLGVNDIPYAKKGGITTGDVAEILEKEYGIMEYFADDIGHATIAAALEISATNALEAILMGAPPTLSLTSEAESDIEAAFKLFLSQREMDGRIPGVPTRAALMGFSHRFKKPHAKGNAQRPSFIDTGTYSANFRAWVD